MINYREQEQFIKMVSENIAAKTDVLKVIIAGDWNTTLKQTDKYGGIPWKETAYRNSIIDLMEELGLQDIYRKLHPNTKARFRRRSFHEPNLIRIWTDPN